MIDNVTVELSRLQFGLTAMYHFLFVPLTLGLSILLGIFESVYVMTGRTIWRDITKYWGLLFGINFAMGVATGITMEFQFGTNWAYYSHYVGDIFGAPLAIEGLMAFFLEASFIGLFFFGWDRLSKIGHLVVTWLVALGSNLSALWILVANGWMQHPVGAKFNPASMRMEVANFSDVLFNPVAQAKFVHTVSAGYVTGSVFVMAISAWFLLKGRNREFARRSMTVAASFGLASALSVVVLGDESGYTASENQKMKLAAIEAMWHTQPAPASFTAFGFPDLATHTTHAAIEVPWVMGIIGTRSFTEQIPGILDLVESNKKRIANGEIAYGALEDLRKHPNDAATRTKFEAHVGDLGYGLLLKRYSDKVTDATPAQIAKAAWDTVPNVPALFWSFRFMVGLGFFFIAFFAFAFWLSAKHRLEHLQLVPAACRRHPAAAVDRGRTRLVRGGERTPTVDDRRHIADLPVDVEPDSRQSRAERSAASSLFYSVLAVVELYLMVKYIRLGPDAEFPSSAAPGAPALSPEGGR